MQNILDKYTKEEMENQLIKNDVDADIDIENEEDDDIELFDQSERKLYVDKTDKSTSDWIRMIKQKYINLQPDYQRSVVWDSKMMSKFIESLLLSIPIPTIFLAENEDETLEVIDGQQRITSIFAFMKSEFNSEELEELPQYLKEIKPLILTKLETLSDFNRKKYEDLPEIKNKFSNISIPVVIIKKDSSEDIKYDIFSRINSGSVKLNNQELLNVMYRGDIINAINDISNSILAEEIFGKRPIMKKRKGYNEVLLRAITMECFICKDTWKLIEVKAKHSALLGKESKKYNGRLKTAVLNYLKEYRNDSEEAERIKEFLLDSLEKVKLVFGEDAFKRVLTSRSTKINKTISELQLVVLSRFDKELIENNKDKIKSSFEQFLKNNNEGLFTRGTNNTVNVEKRYLWGMEVQRLLEDK